MSAIWKTARAIFTGIFGTLGVLLGGFDGLLIALCVFMVIDVITGVSRAVVEKTLSSRIMFLGLLRKLLVFFLVIVGHVVDLYVIRTGDGVRSMIIAFYIANDGLSILENSVALGLPVPGKLRAILAQLREKGNETGGKK